MKQLAYITATINIALVSAAFIAWYAVWGNAISAINLAGLLALIAFSLMWTHYLSDSIREVWYPDQTVGFQYDISRWVVLFAILLHPALINLYLYQNSFGLPPSNYQAFYGQSLSFFIVLGTLALTIFLAFELKSWLVKRGWWAPIWHGQHLAMFLILIHGFQLGTVTNSLWYTYVWAGLATGYVFLATRLYLARYSDEQSMAKRYLTIAAIAILSIAVIASAIL